MLTVSRPESCCERLKLNYWMIDDQFLLRAVEIIKGV